MFNVKNRAEFRFEFGANFFDALVHHLVSRVLHPELSVASLSQILQIFFSFYSCHRSLEIWVTKFCIQESQAFKRPRHVVVYLLLTFQRVAHVGTFGSVASALQIV